MTEAIVCDRCEGVEKFTNRATDYSLSRRVCDTAAHEDAVDVRANGHLCEDCSREFAEWLDAGGDS